MSATVAYERPSSRSAAYRLHRLSLSHPEWWVTGAAATAWVVLARLGADAGETAHLGHHHASGSISEEIGRALVMSTAMMAPLALPALRRIALTSLWRRRHRVQAMFLAGFLSTWTVVVVALGAAFSALGAVMDTVVVTAAVCAIAAAWQFTPLKRRALRRCSRSVPLAPRGWRASAGCVRFGAVNAGSCIATCGGIMAVAASTGHSLVPMLALFGVQLHERIARDYGPATGAAVLVLVAGWSAVML